MTLEPETEHPHGRNDIGSRDQDVPEFHESARDGTR